MNSATALTDTSATETITPGMPFISAQVAPMQPLRRAKSHPVAHGANVLLVDHHSATRKLLGNFLQWQGYHVWRAADAPEAQALLARQQMDLVMLDVLLPDGNGPELIRQLRDAAMAERPIVIISSLGSTRNVCAGLACGADDYIAKPVALGVIAARLGAVLRRYGWRAA
jgi:DNA-binding response OmpR family regulator